MPQTYQQVRRPELDPAVDAGNSLVPPTELIDRSGIDTLFADVEASQQELAKRLGNPALSSCVKPSFNWNDAPLANDRKFVRYSHEANRWLEDHER